MSLGPEIPDVSKDGSAFFLRGKAYQAELFSHCSTLEYEGNKIFDMLATIHPSTQLHNPEELNPQHHHCDNLAKSAN
jgi:uracil-DNA glycosylase